MVPIRICGRGHTSALGNGQALSWLPGIFDPNGTTDINSRTRTQGPLNPGPLEINPNISRLQISREWPLPNRQQLRKHQYTSIGYNINSNNYYKLRHFSHKWLTWAIVPYGGGIEASCYPIGQYVIIKERYNSNLKRICASTTLKLRHFWRPSRCKDNRGAQKGLLIRHYISASSLCRGCLQKALVVCCRGAISTGDALLPLTITPHLKDELAYVRT